MPSFVAVGCVEIGEKFMLVGGGAVISSTKIKLHKPDLGCVSVQLLPFCQQWLEFTRLDPASTKPNIMYKLASWHHVIASPSSTLIK